MSVQNKKETSRRQFLLLSGAALAMVRPAFADRAKPKIGYLSWFPDSMKDDLDHFREGMEKVGYREGDYDLEFYFTGGNPQSARDAVRKLVDKPVGLLSASSASAFAHPQILETLSVMNARIVRDAVMVIDVPRRGADARSLAADPEVGRALRGVMDALALASGSSHDR